MNPWKPLNGKKPRTDAELQVRFRNGMESRWTYTAGQLRWTDTGCEFDIVAARKA